VERFARIDRRVIYLLAVALVALTYLVPLGLPLAVSDEVRVAYEVVDGLPSGSVVIITPMYDSIDADQLNPMFMAFLTHCAERGYRILIGSPGWPEGSDLVEQITLDILEGYDYLYGRDYLVFGGHPDACAWMTLAAEDFSRACSGVDSDGRPLGSLPLARAVPRLAGGYVQAILVLDTATPGADEWFTYVAGPGGIPVVVGASAIIEPEIGIPVRSPTPVQARVTGLRECAEYERLVGHLGDATKSQDVLSLLALMIVVLVALGNVGELRQRRKAMRPKKETTASDWRRPTSGST